MTNSPFPLNVLIAVLAVLGLVLALRTGSPLRRLPVMVTLLHPLLSIVLFFSLAIHMHRSLGRWPSSLGDRGFPPALVAHADSALSTFGALLLACIFVWPLALVLCTVVPKWRPGLRYLGLYAIASSLTYGAMMLAPDPFLSWWWD